MRIVEEYSYKGAKELLERNFAPEMKEIQEVLAGTTEKGHRSPSGSGRLLPGALKRTIRDRFGERGWDRQRIKVEMLHAPKRAVYRDLDYVKNRIGVDVQFGKVALMVYNAFGKMPIFKDEDLIDLGIEIVPVKALAEQMSSGVSYFEQFVWDIEHRGSADIDIPVLIMGVDL
jgi:hypothetical protein